MVSCCIKATTGLSYRFLWYLMVSRFTMSERSTLHKQGKKRGTGLRLTAGHLTIFVSVSGRDWAGQGPRH